MKSPINFKFNLPETNTYILIIGILSVMLLVFNLGLGAVALLIFLYIIYHNWKVTNIRRKEWTKYIENLSVDMDDTSKQALLNLPIPLCILEFDGTIAWYNTRFSDLVNKKEALEKNIEEFFPDISLRKTLNEDKELYTKLDVKDKKYELIYNIVKTEEDGSTKYIIMVYWFDKTEYDNLLLKYKEERPAILSIQVDSLDEVLESSTEDARPVLQADVERSLKAWAEKLEGALRKTAKDKYTLIVNEKSLDFLEKDKFSILDEMRKLDHGNKLPITLSMGVGSGAKTFRENLKLAVSALDLALGRGGDQAVIKRNDRSVFYGGRSKAVEKKTKVKARLIAHALRDLIIDSSNVLIMGHSYPDLDALGAAIGVNSMCDYLGKSSNIVLQNSNSSIEVLMDRLRRHDYYKDVFVSREEALKLTDKNTVLIVVDTHRPSFTEYPALLEIAEKVVLIDHHRRGLEFIDNAVLTYHETYASSACEMVTELIQYISDKPRIDVISAEALLAGITLDTKNFTFKTGVRTFEAAAMLRKLGADTVSVKQLFQGDLDSFISKADVIKNAKIIGGKIALSSCPENLENPQLLAAQVADELLNIKGVRASFVVGRSKESVAFISARSMGDINVHIFMEKLGGGGHIDIAGAQLRDTTSEEALEKLEELIMEYLKEEE